jgi:hypothetical protein
MVRTLLTLGGAALLLSAVPPRAESAQTTQNVLAFGAKRYVLPYVIAVKSLSAPDQIWVVMTTAPVSAADAADRQVMIRKAMNGQLRGVRVGVDATQPRMNELQMGVLVSRTESPTGEISVGGGGGRFWNSLALTNNRVQGQAQVVWDTTENGTTPWTADLNFNTAVLTVK